MDRGPASAIVWLFDRQRGAPDRLIPRWLFLRALGAIYFSAFFSLVFQIRGLIGPEGILPASRYLHAVEQSLGHWQRVWYAPTLLWFSGGPVMLSALYWAGMLASPVACPEFVAARHAGHVLRMLSLVRQRRAGLLRLPIRRHAAGGWFHQLLFCPARISSRTMPPTPRLARQPVHAAVGVVSHLDQVR